MKLNREQWQVVAIVGAVRIVYGLSVSFMSLLYPPEAERKGASATEYGLVLGLQSLIQIIASPTIGKNINKYGCRFVMVTGMMLHSVAQICFGSEALAFSQKQYKLMRNTKSFHSLLYYIENTILFIGLSLILRIVQSFGSSCTFVSGFPLIAAAFPHDVGTIFAILATFLSVGSFIGPIIAGVLYTFGGFSFPFVLGGFVGLTLALFTRIFLTNVTGDHQENNKDEVTLALKNPRIVVHLVSECIFSMATGFYRTLLEPHLRQFRLSTQVTSLLMASISLANVISAPTFGRVIDKGLKPRTLIIFTFILLICGFMIIGPAPFLPYCATVVSSIFALVLTGIALGGMVATFVGTLESAKDTGFPDTLETYAFISGLWNSSYCLGEFIGDSGSGILYDLVGFRWTTQFYVVTYIILLPVLVIYCPAKTYKMNRFDESVPILKGKTVLAAKNKRSIKSEA